MPWLHIHVTFFLALTPVVSTEELYLHGNGFEGEIPPGLGEQTKMHELTLYDNPGLKGDINEICKNFDKGTGLLKVAQVDQANVACQCCGNGAGLVPPVLP